MRFDPLSSSPSFNARRLAQIFLLGYFLTSLFLAGCTTTQSMPLDRHPSDQLHPAMCKATKGIPITIKIPTHVDVYVYEKLYFDIADNMLAPVPTAKPNYWVDIRPIETEKVMAVDWKRPLAGSLAYSAKLGDDQYFDAIGSKIEDETLESVTAAIKAVAGVKTSRKSKQGLKLHVEDRVVGYQRFDLDQHNVESDILCFVEQHLNTFPASYGNPLTANSSGTTLIHGQVETTPIPTNGAPLDAPGQ